MPNTERWQNLRYAVVDVEGNGASPPDIVEIACVEVDGGAIAEPGREWLVKPPIAISPLVSRIHGIRDADVAGAPTLEQISAEVLAKLNGRVLVAHSVGVEKSVLGRAFGDQWQPLGAIDTLRLAKVALPGLDSYSLTSVVDALGIVSDDTSGARHRALFDAALTAQVFLALVARLHATSFDELSAIQAPKRSRRKPPSEDNDQLF